MADRLLVVLGGELAAVGVAEQQPHPHALLGLGAQGLQPLGMLLGEKQPGEGEQIHRAAGAA